MDLLFRDVSCPKKCHTQKSGMVFVRIRCRFWQPSWIYREKVLTEKVLTSHCFHCSSQPIIIGHGTFLGLARPQNNISIVPIVQPSSLKFYGLHLEVCRPCGPHPQKSLFLTHPRKLKNEMALQI